jgi:hypothetical protein
MASTQIRVLLGQSNTIKANNERLQSDGPKQNQHQWRQNTQRSVSHALCAVRFLFLGGVFMPFDL